ncbi:TetR/AcrR family transcriptional regulator [Treponema succinifaciens]|uniref:Regulatory protein TetR n=2 Tax=Treponema TaxID=157 RepID=F2NUH6_TRES6|nr:TetR/AcrR family transcriptional regulator [Treponema succinifaciens]AEB13539.1 regulatory protein TetR [Treponema succinifaciens DSM 2489]MDD6962760.1 helix-turn-helix domain containing protein [Treponema succinifaciens]MDY5116836.1 helix-turn-helix domain-containing protein [Treponema succinifaciens]
MSCETKEQIIETALELFSQNGFLGTSMSDIASQLKITKGALYKHYESKQQILEQIIERMAKLDLERAKKYEMPETEQKKFAEAYIHIPTEKIREYSIAQFRHWTEENFSAKFRKMLTLEQFRSKEMSDLYQNYLGTGPLEYMTKIFKKMTKSKPKARQLALEFYGPIFILYSVYDGAEENAKKSVFVQLENHIKNFIERLEKERAEK